MTLTRTSTLVLVVKPGGARSCRHHARPDGRRRHRRPPDSIRTGSMSRERADGAGGRARERAGRSDEPRAAGPCERREQPGRPAPSQEPLHRRRSVSEVDRARFSAVRLRDRDGLSSADRDIRRSSVPHSAGSQLDRSPAGRSDGVLCARRIACCGPGSGPSVFASPMPSDGCSPRKKARKVSLPHPRVRARPRAGAERSRYRASRRFATATRCPNASSSRSRSGCPRAVTNAARNPVSDSPPVLPVQPATILRPPSGLPIPGAHRSTPS